LDAYNAPPPASTSPSQPYDKEIDESQRAVALAGEPFERYGEPTEPYVEQT